MGERTRRRLWWLGRILATGGLCLVFERFGQAWERARWMADDILAGPADGPEA